MKIREENLAMKHIDEILNYQAVLSNLLRRKVTIEQAMADWIDKGFAKKYMPK